jgi:hypothetical protein
MFKYFIYFFLQQNKVHTLDNKPNKYTDYRKKYITVTKFNFHAGYTFYQGNFFII